MDKVAMEESISSSWTTAFYDGNSYYCNYHYHHQQQPPAAPPPPAAASSDFADADSSWTDYFLQLASDKEDEEEDASASASNREKKLQLRDVGAVPACGSGSGRGSASLVSKPKKGNKDNKEAVKEVLKKGVKKTRIVEEEDPLQDTASSPLVQLNII